MKFYRLFNFTIIQTKLNELNCVGTSLHKYIYCVFIDGLMDFQLT